jgi:hypothetical protein
MRTCLWVFAVVLVFGFVDGKKIERLRTERISGGILLSP